MAKRASFGVFLKRFALAFLLSASFFGLNATPIFSQTNANNSKNSNQNVNQVADRRTGSSSTNLSSFEIMNLTFWGLSGICLILILSAAYIWIMASGRDEEFEKAKKIMTVAILSLLVILFVWIVTLYVFSLVRNLSNL